MADKTPRYINKSQVRTVTGITSTLVSDDDVDDIIYDIEFQIERFLNTTYTPKKEIDVLDGRGKHIIYVKNTPLLALHTITDDGVTIDLTTINHQRSGRIRFTSGSTGTVTSFKERENKVIVEYVYGTVEFPTSGGTETLLNGASAVGTAVNLTVDGITGFADNDWCEIYGTDGEHEAFQIGGSPAGSTIVADRLVTTHSDNSFIRKMTIPNMIERLMKVSAGIAMVAVVVGSSFDDIVAYSMGQFSVTKGEPYTQWRETALQLINERDRILEKVQTASYGITI